MQLATYCRKVRKYHWGKVAKCILDAFGADYCSTIDAAMATGVNTGMLLFGSWRYLVAGDPSVLESIFSDPSVASDLENLGQFGKDVLACFRKPGNYYMKPERLNIMGCFYRSYVYVKQPKPNPVEGWTLCK